MLTLHRSEVDLAHEQVFGCKPPPSAAAAAAAAAAEENAAASRQPRPPASAPPPRVRPPRHPTPGVGRALAPRQPQDRRGVLGSTLNPRQGTRRRVLLSSRITAVEDPVAAAAAVRQEYYTNESSGGEEQPQMLADGHGYSSPIPMSASTSLVSTSVPTIEQIKGSAAEPSPPASPPSPPPPATAVAVTAPRAHPYYFHFQSPPPSEANELDEDAARHGRRLAEVPAMDQECGVGDAAVESSPSRAVALAHPRGRGSPSPRAVALSGATSATATAAALGSADGSGGGGAASVFDRLAGESSMGMASLGRRVRQWAEGAGLVLHPAGSVWQALRLYAMEPLRHERLWRQTCAKGRYRVSLLARARRGGGGGGAVADAAADSPERGVARPPTHADPHQEMSSLVRRRRSVPSAAPGGRLAYRRQQEYTRWCQWQLWNFYGQGSLYLTSVWRIAPHRGHRRRRPAALGIAVGDAGQSAASTTSLSLLFDGRYAVPSTASIDALQDEVRARARQARVVVSLLLEEKYGSSAPTSAAPSRSRGASAPGDAARDAAGEEEEEVAEDDDNVYRTINDSRRSSAAVATTEPYMDVRMDESTGLLHFSLYVGGDAGGGGGDGGAEFVGSGVAGCIDNHRWVVLKGLWARQVLVFCFHNTSSSNAPAFPDGTAREYEERRVHEYDERVEAHVSRCSALVDGVVVKGVAFAKVRTEEAATTSQDAFACTRCGHTRHQHNEVYISKQTGRMVRGMYYCPVCRMRTRHVRLPPRRAMPAVLLSDTETHAAEWGAVSTARGPSASSWRSSAPSTHRAASARSGLLPTAVSRPYSSSSEIVADGGVAVAAAAISMQEWACTAAAAPRPAWQPSNKVDHDHLFGPKRGLDCPPPRPRM